MSELVKVGNYINRFAAETAKGILNKAGIESYIRADDIGGTDSAVLLGGGGAWLIVLAENAQRASEVLHSAGKMRKALRQEGLTGKPMSPSRNEMGRV